MNSIRKSPVGSYVLRHETIPLHAFVSTKMNECHTEELKKRRVLIINTGGSIGSRHTDKGKYGGGNITSVHCDPTNLFQRLLLVGNSE